MDVIGLFMRRDVFVAAPSVLTSESTEFVVELPFRVNRLID